MRLDFQRVLGDEGKVHLDSDVCAVADAQQSHCVVLDVPPSVLLGAADVIVAIATDADGRGSEFSWDPVTLAVSDSADLHPAGSPFAVDVEALALEGPFRPNGVVDVSMYSTPAQTCAIALQAHAPANTIGVGCTLDPPTAGTITISAIFRGLRGVFTHASGPDVVTTILHTATTPGPEHVGFPRCRRRLRPAPGGARRHRHAARVRWVKRQASEAAARRTLPSGRSVNGFRCGT